MKTRASSRSLRTQGTKEEHKEPRKNPMKEEGRSHEGTNHGAPEHPVGLPTSYEERERRPRAENPTPQLARGGRFVVGGGEDGEDEERGEDEGEDHGGRHRLHCRADVVLERQERAQLLPTPPSAKRWRGRRRGRSGCESTSSPLREASRKKRRRSGSLGGQKIGRSEERPIT